jgi:hypothetical protein
MADYVSLSEQRRLIIAILPIAEQRGIAEVLGALDDKIACNDRTRRRCDELLQAMFQRTAAPALSHLVGGGVLPPGWLADSLGDWLRVLETGSRPKGALRHQAWGAASQSCGSVSLPPDAAMQQQP